MSYTHLALDSNLAVLWVVGRAERGIVTRHKRLRNYTQSDWELLAGFVVQSEVVIITPSTATEISNLAPQGLLDPYRARVMASVTSFVQEGVEVYQQSRTLVAYPEYDRLGLTDCSMLGVLDYRTRLLTADRDLQVAALGRGLAAEHFDDVRMMHCSSDRR